MSGRKWLVTVQRVEYRDHVFEVAGASERAAALNARKAADTHDFSGDPVSAANESVTRVLRKPAGKKK